MPSGSNVVEAAMSKITQWTKSPDGASGSFTIRASDLAADGTPLKLKAGDLSSPEQVNPTGIRVLLVKAELLSVIPQSPTAGVKSAKQTGPSSAIKRQA